jgi:hypothetical protein
VTVNNGATRVGVAVAALACSVGAGALAGEELALKVRAAVVGSSEAPLTIELYRWSTDGERAPLLAAPSTPPQGPPAPADPAAPAAGRGAPAAPGAAGRGGRGGRGGGRGGGQPQSPAARLTTAIKAAPTIGFIWGAGPTGYSIKYAWRSASSDGQERVVLATDRRLGAHSASWPAATGAAADAEFTVVEMRIDGKGLGEAKTSLTSTVVVDATSKTLALDAYADAPALLKVTR